MRRLCVLALVVSVSGCTCGKQAPSSAPPSDAPAPIDAGPKVEFELDLQRTALVAFGNTTPLPVSEEFQEPVAALLPPLERAAKQRPNLPLRMRVARDVPFGQLTRLMQTALGYRVLSWDLAFEPAQGGPLVTVHVLSPGPTPRGNCWARAWVGPDQRVLAGIDVNAEVGSAMHGVLVPAKDARVDGAGFTDVIRRMDAHCKDGQVRIYSQPTARAGGALDAARALGLGVPPHLTEVLFSVPSVGALDTPDELFK